MSDNLDEIIRVRVSRDLKETLQALADRDERDLAQLARKILIDYAREQRVAATRLNDAPAKYSVAGRSKLPPGKRGVAKKEEN